MAISIMVHTNGAERFKVEAITQATGGVDYPVISIQFGSGVTTEHTDIFPSFEQVKQIHEELGNYIKESEELGRFKKEGDE